MGEGGWGVWIINVIFFFVIILLLVFLMVLVVLVFMLLFFDCIVSVVEDKYFVYFLFVDLVFFSEVMKDMVNFLGVLIGVNILVLLIYLVFLFFVLLIFWGFNGFFLGCEYFFIVVMCCIGCEGVKELCCEYFVIIWIVGMLMVILLFVFLVNFLILILGVVIFIYLFYMLEECFQFLMWVRLVIEL